MATLQEEAHSLINQVINSAYRELEREFNRNTPSPNFILDDVESTISSESRATYRDFEPVMTLPTNNIFTERGPNINWTNCNDFTVQKGKEQINEYVKVKNTSIYTH